MMEEHFQALKAFALRNKRSLWRGRLALAWYNGDYARWGSDSREAALLQALRNHPEHGGKRGFLRDFNPGFPPKVQK